MEQMPGDILHHGGVPGEHALGVDHLVGRHADQLFLIMLGWHICIDYICEFILNLVSFDSSIDVPETKSLIITCREKMSVHVWVPGQAVPDEQVLQSFNLFNHFARLTLPSCALSDETPAYTCHWGPAAPLSACWCRTQAPR